MGYLAYEAAALLDGHPSPHPADAPCPPIGLLVIDRAVVFDHWRQRLILVAHVPAGGYDEGVAALEELAGRIAEAATPPLATVQSPETVGAGEANMSDEEYREIVSSFKEHILAGDIYQGVPSRRVSFDAAGGGFPIYRRLRVSNPAPYMFFLRMVGYGAGGFLARAARPCRGSAGVRPADRRHPSPRSDRGTRPAARARAAGGPEGAGRARDARRSRAQRPRPSVRARQRPPHRADAGGAVLEGDAHRVDRGGRSPGRPAPARRAGRDVPGRHGDRGAQAPGDGADRGARADRLAARTPAPSATSRSPATSTSASRSGPR